MEEHYGVTFDRSYRKSCAWTILAGNLGTVRIGLIGLGTRGPGSLRRLCLIEGIEIKAICDIREDRVKKGQELRLKRTNIRGCGC